MKPQNELPGAEQVFNLAGEAGDDPSRVARERLEAKVRAEEYRKYAERMQRTLSECPGFIGADPPITPQGVGRVVVEPALALEARLWLKRRFICADALEVQADGLCMEVIPRVRHKSGGGRRVKVTFAKPVQFELSL